MKQLKSVFLIFVVCLLSGCSIALQPVQAAAYGNRIVLPANASKPLLASAADAADALQKMTGQKYFLANEYSGAGIFLMRSDAANVPADLVAQLKDKGREPFVIRSSDDNNLWIIANDDQGLIQGLYFYLDQLGVRYYFPNDNWTIIPKRDDISIKIDRLVAPSYHMRTFFGTGGFGPGGPLDPKRSMNDRWALWKQRNGFGGEFMLAGATGEAFNAANKATLQAHPDYLANVDGKYVPWSVIAKPNTANPAAVQLYVDWSLQRFRQMRKTDPNNSILSVEPADGGGFCNSDACKQIGNGSDRDQVFYIANQVAKAVRKEFPNGKVSLFAYNTHAGVPSFPLEPNVYVTVIPYAFQNTGMTPDELIEAWGKKVGEMSIYDYWSIPDWTHDMPSFNYLSTPAQKLRYWRANNIDGFMSESTFSSGAMGIGWYVASRLMWNPQTEVKPLLDDFYNQAFGPAKAPMQQMLERWATGFYLNQNELALSYRDMSQAVELAQGRPDVLARLSDYARYLGYLRLCYVLQTADKDHKQQALSDLVKYVWRIFDSTMITSFREYQLLTRNDPELRQIYNPSDMKAVGFQGLTQVSDTEALQSIPAGVQEFQPLPDFMPQSFSGNLVPVPAGTPAAPLDAKPKQEPGSMFVLGTMDFEFQAAEGTKTLVFKVSSKSPVRVQLLDESGKVLFDQQNKGLEPPTPLAPPPSWEEFVLPIPNAGQYKISLRQGKNAISRVQVPSTVPLVMSSFRTAKPTPSPRLYFYVPKGQKTVVLVTESALPSYMQPQFWDAAGNPVPMSVYDAGLTFYCQVPPGQDGKIWAIDRIVTPNYPMNFLNVPEVFSFYPNTLMVPRDALGKGF